MAKTKELKKSPFMVQKKAKNRHVSIGKSRLARKSGSSFSRALCTKLLLLHSIHANNAEPYLEGSMAV